MNELIVTLESENNTQRFYRLNTKIKKVPNESHNYEDEFEYRLKQIKPEYEEELKEYSEGSNIYCISDAHTHTERLAFIGVKIKDNYGRFALHADGKITMMIHGGNNRDVHPDKVYLRRLAKANNMKLVLNE